MYQKFEELGGESFTDLPFNLYWEEFFRKDPTAKVILGVRENEDVWYKSFRRYCDVLAQTDILGGQHLDLAKQDENYAKWIWILEGKIRLLLFTN